MVYGYFEQCCTERSCNCLWCIYSHISTGHPWSYIQNEDTLSKISLHSSFASLHVHWHYMTLLVSPHPYWDVLPCSFFKCHSSGEFVVISNLDFNCTSSIINDLKHFLCLFDHLDVVYVPTHMHMYMWYLCL